IEPIRESGEIFSVLRQMNDPRSFHRVIFLSENAVRIFTGLINPAFQAWRRLKVLAVGPKTAQVAREMGWESVRIPARFDSRGILSSIGSGRHRKILIPRVEN